MTRTTSTDLFGNPGGGDDGGVIDGVANESHSCGGDDVPMSAATCTCRIAGLEYYTYGWQKEPGPTCLSLIW